MTQLSLDARNYMVQIPELVALLGSSQTWPQWVFDQKPFVLLENSQKCLIVVNEATPFTIMNSHNTMKFPRLQVDVWADPTRLPDNTMATPDADDKIGAIIKVLDDHFHTTNIAVPSDAPAYQGTPGFPRVWGTAEQVAERTGTIVLGSVHGSGPSYNDVSDGDGARMATVMYDVTTF